MPVPRYGYITASIAVVFAVAMMILRLKKNNLRESSIRIKRNRKKILVVETESQWEDIYMEFKENVQNVKVIGLDCEWVNKNPVSLVQMATQDGLCILLRVNHFHQSIPNSLKTILEDRSIIKVGIAIHDDAKRLIKDHGILVRGCVDLRNILARQRGNLQSNIGLKRMAKDICDIDLDKNRQLRCGDWEKQTLSQEMITYAANDAISAVDIFTELVLRKCKENNNPDLKLFTKKAQSICQGLVDANFEKQYKNKTKKEHGQSIARPQSGKDTTRSYLVRNSPLYHNCQLRAPDGQLLCTCDQKKAQWYIDKGLGDKVSDDPFTIKLNFEPSGRPESAQNYYLQVKDNKCVVCGSQSSYIRKNIVPHEYRKYFPSIMKDHLSHDIVLLCTKCHQRSSCSDAHLREIYARQCDAPVDTDTARFKQDKDLNRIKSSAKALLYSRDKIPVNRRLELELILQNYYGTPCVDDEIVQRAVNIDTRLENHDYISHGLRVVQHITEHGGLIEFERVWRKHFIDTMKPQFLPPHWSIDHNHSRLQVINSHIHASFQPLGNT